MIAIHLLRGSSVERLNDFIKVVNALEIIVNSLSQSDLIRFP